MSKGNVFDIQRFAVHDGPGIRTTVFFKGCSCRCAWCHNPESQTTRPVLEFYPSRCIGCGRCLAACSRGAQQNDNQGQHLIRRELCDGCGACVATCYANALVLKGRSQSVAEVMAPIVADKAYYLESGGGVTLSGGEPVLQSEFARDLLQACKREGLHTALQTAGSYPFPLLEPLLEYLDMIMYDIKGYAPEIYRDHIHGDRDLIFANLRKLDATFSGEIIVRTPCIGSVNDNEEEIASIARMLQGMKNLTDYRLLPYHGLAKTKYDALNATFADAYYTPSPERMALLEEIARTILHGA